MMTREKPYYLLYGLVLSGLVALFVVLALTDVHWRETILKEGGPVETLSVAGYFVGAVLVYALGKRSPSSWCAILMLFFFGCRELDLHKRFTPTSNVLKYRFYSSPEVSGIEKTLGAVVILLVLYCCFRLVKDNLVGFLRATSYGEPHALGVFGGVLLLIMSKSLDNFGHKLTKLGITVDRHIIDFTHGIEEIVELGIPLLFIIATMARFTLAPSARQGTLRGSTPKPRMLSLGLFGVGGSILVASALFAVLGYRPYFSSLHVPERWVLLCLASGALSGLLIGGAVGWRAPWQRSGQSWTACPLSQSHASLDFPPVAPTSRLFVADAGEGQDEGVETAPDGQPALHSPDRVCRS